MKHLALAVSLLALLVSPLAAAQEELPAVGRTAPIFRLPVYNADAVGSTVVGLDRLVGQDSTDKDVKVVLLSFMASFCAPCKKEMPYLQMLHEKYKDFGLRVVMVSIDTEPEGQKIISDLIALNKITFPVLKDRFNLVARRWLGNQSPLPSVFMVKPDGLVSMVHRGYNQEAGELFASEIEQSLGIKRGSIAVAVTPAPTPTVVPAGTQEGGTTTTAAVGAGGTEGSVSAAPATGKKKPLKKKPLRKKKPAAPAAE